MATNDDQYMACWDSDHYDLAFQIAVMAMAEAAESGDDEEAERWKGLSLECLEFAEMTETDGVKH